MDVGTKSWMLSGHSPTLTARWRYDIGGSSPRLADGAPVVVIAATAASVHPRSPA